jgi:hypothetical protein
LTALRAFVRRTVWDLLNEAPQVFVFAGSLMFAAAFLLRPAAHGDETESSRLGKLFLGVYLGVKTDPKLFLNKTLGITNSVSWNHATCGFVTFKEEAKRAKQETTWAIGKKAKEFAFGGTVRGVRVLPFQC